jgi:hypothetical protein
MGPARITLMADSELQRPSSREVTHVVPASTASIYAVAKQRHFRLSPSPLGNDNRPPEKAIAN